MTTFPKKHGVAEAVLLAVGAYSKMDMDDAKVVMTKALASVMGVDFDDPEKRQAVYEYVTVMQTAAIAGVPASDLADVIGRWATGATLSSVSPHSRNKVRRPKPDFWIKVITSFDPNVKNGYGLKGKFVNPEDVSTLDDNTIMVIQLTDRKSGSKIMYLAKSYKRGGTLTPFDYPKKVKPSIQIPDVGFCLSYNNYDDLHRQLRSMGVSETT